MDSKSFWVFAIVIVVAYLAGARYPALAQKIGLAA